MHHVLVAGAGKIGSLIAALLADAGNYRVFLTDINPDAPLPQKVAAHADHLTVSRLDAESPAIVSAFLREHAIETVVSSLPYFCNTALAKIAHECNVNYFDLTEDTRTTASIRALAKETTRAFVPQCGLAPGFISIVANDLMKQFSSLETVKMRVGALPVNISNALQYSLTWSTDGLINEYGNLCAAIENGQEVTLLPLDDLEEIKIDGLTYEAFNTSGGIGSLAETWQNKVHSISYKTIRYPGHCKKMRFLMNDLKLNDDRDTLKRILEKALPKTGQDVVLVYVSVVGKQDGSLIEKNYVRKFYPRRVNNIDWSAIQLTTASSLCAVLDLVVKHPEKYKGFVAQEAFSLENITQNHFGEYFV
ncbi:MAG: saccharopine dehydrogenase C-terminal domain-containing protein [Gammaproteobacteria bacterium]|nr:saccharopine dehydrogenase C-terminal domain-containing protein [Gammaproteobacteria bacterium]